MVDASLIVIAALALVILLARQATRLQFATQLPAPTNPCGFMPQGSY
jgi:hypothetical protein